MLLQAHSASCHTQEASMASEHSNSELASFQPRGNSRAMNKSALCWEQKRQRWCVYCFLSFIPTHGQDKIKMPANKRWGPMNCNSPFHSDTQSQQRIAKMRVPQHTCVSQPHMGLVTTSLSNCSFGTTNPTFFFAASSSFLHLPFPSIHESAFKIPYQEKLWQHSQGV